MKKFLLGFGAPGRMIATLVLGAVLLAATTGGAVVFAGECTNDVSGQPLANGIDCAQPDGTPTELIGDDGVFTTITNILLFLVGLIAVIMLIIGGIRYAISGGDQSAVTAAKNTILYAIVGIIVAFMAYAIVQFVSDQLAENTAYITHGKII